VRDYAFGDGDDGIAFALNRNTPYDPDDPTHGPPDVNAVIKSLDDQFHISFPVSVDYVFQTSDRTQLKIGLMRNIAIKPISDSELTVIMYGETYKGKYSPLTGFWGVNIQFDYNLKKKFGESFERKIENSNLKERYRKALYVERRGSGISLTANYDMRLKKNRNDGLGFKAGIGNGRTYYTPVTNNNISTRRTYISVPLGINYVIGNKRHGLESGIGFTSQVALDDVEDGPGFISTIPLNIGYRFQPLKEGLIARVAWTPIIHKDGFYGGWTGLSLGYSF
ncbi:MAG: hypothetical protein WBJ10_13585, partial [Daejeonella sp.]|uniref:hypothetical protein n=1 Tax=Daejeonella sp. TaxID=2805397 RepID=UPI003C730387